MRLVMMVDFPTPSKMTDEFQWSVLDQPVEIRLTVSHQQYSDRVSSRHTVISDSTAFALSGVRRFDGGLAIFYAPGVYSLMQSRSSIYLCSQLPGFTSSNTADPTRNTA